MPDYGEIGQGLGQFIGNLFNNPRESYRKAQREYGGWMDRAAGAYNPFWEAGTNAIGGLQNRLGEMQDPSGFINQLMSKYQESPWAQRLMDTSRRAGENAASASGLLGSTPFAQFQQENAANISSQDMQNWLSQVLGINSEYLKGQQGLYGGGLNAAGGLANIFGQRAGDEAQFEYNKERAKQQRWAGLFGGAARTIGGLFGGGGGGGFGGGGGG